MTATTEISVEEAERRYATYVEPLEPDHRGEFAAVSRDGTLVLAPTLDEAMDRAIADLGPDNVIFKVGQFAVGKWLNLQAEE